MSVQSNLDIELFNKLSLIKKCIYGAEEFERNQMICATIRACLCNCRCIDKLNDLELVIFQNDLIEVFKTKGWLK